MLDNDNPNEQNEPTAGAPAPDPSGDAGAAGGGSAEEAPAPAKKAVRKSAAKKAPAKKSTTKKAAAKRTTKKAAASEGDTSEGTAAEGTAVEAATEAPAEGTAAETGAGEAPAKKAAAKRTTKKAAAKKTAAKRTAARRTTKKAAAEESEAAEPGAAEPASEESTLAAGEAAVEPPAAAASLTAAEAPEQSAEAEEPEQTEQPEQPEQPQDTGEEQEGQAGPAPAPAVLFKAPEKAPTRRRRRTAAAEAAEGDEVAVAEERSAERAGTETADATKDTGDAKDTGDRGKTEGAPSGDTEGADENADEGEDEQGSGGGRRRRRRGGRRRRKGNGGEGSQTGAQDGADESDDEKAGKAQQGKAGKAGKDTEGEESSSDTDEGGSGSSRRRRRRRRSGEEGDGSSDDPENTVTRVRKARNPEDEITALQGSTRLEAKKQRRREGREAGRRRAPIVSEAEFLARRESVDRVMVIRQKKDLTQIAVLEDKVLVEHYVARESQTSLIGNVYLGRVQNVLPSMEAAFIDIGKGRNAVLYAGEVNWDALGAGNGPRKIEQVLKSGQSVLVQVTKDPIGHKGARLTSQISLPGRFLVYVPDGTTSGISRKLPDTERNRLKTLLKEIVPDSAGVIVRTAAEGASEDELTRDVERLTARWEDIAAKSEKGNAPQLLYGEPDLTLKVVRDLFTEDFGKLVVSGDDAWDMVEGYVEHVAPDLADRLERYDDDGDVFAAYRIDEQIAKALDRKVWLPSGGSLIIDRTEAMTVVDVNTGKFTGSGGNLEETVTKNNLEAAEEIVRQLRLRDIGGIIVIDFIDMVLESNRDLVLRRLVECLGRDRTRHQVAEVTSLGLVQMTRKRIGTGLVEAFSEPCEHCAGRGLVVHHEPVEQRKKVEEEPRRGRRGRGRKGEDEQEAKSSAPTPKDVAAMARPEPQAAEHRAIEEQPTEAAEAAEAGTRAEAAPTAEPEAGESARTEPEPGAEPAPAAEQEETSATGRGARGGRSRRRPAKQHGVPETAPPTPESTSEPVSEPAPPAEQPESEQPEQPEQPVVPATPTVVTTSRRRVARRPAGPPSGVAVAANGAGTSAPEGAAADGTSPDGTAPAGPGGDATGAEQGEPETVAAAHVPVKKKGARKR